MSDKQKKRVPAIVRWQNSLLCAGSRGPKPSVRATLLTMAVRADNNKLTFYMPVSEIAEWMGVSKSSAERNLNAALKSGWLIQTRRGRTGSPSDYMLRFGVSDNPEGIIPGSSEGDPNPSELTGYNPSDLVSNPSDLVQLPVRTDGPTTNNYSSTTPTTYKGAAAPEFLEVLGGSAKGESVSDELDDSGELGTIPQGWHPNGIHVSHYGPLLPSAVKNYATLFKEWAAGESAVRDNWDSTFSAFLECVMHGADLGTEGFDGIEIQDDGAYSYVGRVEASEEAIRMVNEALGLTMGDLFGPPLQPGDHG